MAPFYFCGSTENQHFHSRTEAGYQSAQTASEISLNVPLKQEITHILATPSGCNFDCWFYQRRLQSTIRSDAQLLLQYDATQRRFGEMENLMKSIEQELNHVFHTIGSENGA